MLGLLERSVETGELLMSDRDSLRERGRAFEDEYFRKKDRELIEKLRTAAAADDARHALSSSTGLDDPALLAELQELGFTPETVSLLPLVPVVQMAWAEGGVSAAERELIVKLARSRGIEAGSPADQQLAGWMASRPSDDIFARASRFIRAMLDAGSAPSGLSADDLVRYCEEIAAASGGILGIGRISAEERALLARIAEDLKGRRE
jgi:hypothetical protein